MACTLYMSTGTESKMSERERHTAERLLLGIFRRRDSLDVVCRRCKIGCYCGLRYGQSTA